MNEQVEFPLITKLTCGIPWANLEIHTSDVAAWSCASLTALSGFVKPLHEHPLENYLWAQNYQEEPSYQFSWLYYPWYIYVLYHHVEEDQTQSC